MVFKLIKTAKKTWWRLDGKNPMDVKSPLEISKLLLSYVPSPAWISRFLKIVGK